MSLVSAKITNGIAVVTIDNPPVSTGNAKLRKALHDTFSELKTDPAVRAIVVESTQAHFYSGSDISEFDGEIAFPSLPNVIDLVDSIEVPVVAALNGLTLGGGLELALCCDARIAADDAKLGLPEVTLGMLPGAGGTVRLPRLVGVPDAVEMIASGRPISATKALELGLVERVVGREVLTATAVEFAESAVKRRAIDLEVPEQDQDAIERAVQQGRRNGKARPNVLQAITLTVDGANMPGREALKIERAAFDELRVSQEAKSLRYLFFAKRAAAKDLSTGAEAKPINRVGIAGAGTMGSSIAKSFLGRGMDVTVYEVSPETLTRASDMLAEAGKDARRWGTLRATTNLQDLADNDLIIDAVFEDMQVKQELLQALEPLTRDETVIASNTSYLNLDEMAQVLQKADRFVGLHFFNPADRNPLLEVVRAAKTSDATLATMAKVVRLLGKTSILARVADGFVANRVYADYRMQAEYIVEDGASPRQVDDAMRDLGFPIGPFAVADMSGLDIAWARRKRLAPTRDPQQRYVTIADTLCEAGRLGKKTGAGWYRYTEDTPRGADDTEVDQIIDESRRQKNIEPRKVSTDEIQQRIVCSMLVAAANLVENGIAQRASDIDVALTEGFGFPKWLGGPVRYASTMPESWILEGMRLVSESDAIGFPTVFTGTGDDISVPVRKMLDSVSGRSKS